MSACADAPDRQASSGRNSVAGRLRVAFTVLLVLLFTAGAAGTVALVLSVRAGEQYTSTHQPLQRLNTQMLQSLTDAETAERGFLITGNVAFLEPFDPGRVRFFEAASEARQLATDAELRALIDEQEEAGRRWFDDFGSPIVELHRRDSAQAIRWARTGRGKALFDMFRTSNAATGTAIESRLRRAHSRVLTIAGVAGSALVLLALTGLVLGSVVARRTTRSITEPLDRLCGTLLDLGQGRQGARAQVAGPAEIRAVAIAVNELAVENQALSALHQERAENEASIRRIAGLLHEHLDVQSVWECAVRELHAVISADRVVGYHSVGGAVQSVIAQSHVSTVAPVVVTGQVDSSPRLAALVRASGSSEAALAVTDVATVLGDDSTAARCLLADTVRSLLVLQLGDGDDELGVLALHVTTDVRAWTTAEVRLFEAVGRVVRHALFNATLYERQQEVLGKLRQLDQDKSDFVSTVSHELRTPLTSITGYLELLLDGDAGALDPEQLSVLSIVDRNSRRLLHLIEDLLTLSRIESGAFLVDRARVPLADLVHAIVRDLAPRVESAALELVVDLAHDSGNVLADAAQIERVMLNLLTNATKFTPPGGRIEIRSERVGATVNISVSDTGVGIPEAEQPRLFERFFRASTAIEHSVPGTGLGLRISRTIIEHHGGSMEICSQPGVGTTVRFSLLVADELAAAAS